MGAATRTAFDEARAWWAAEGRKEFDSGLDLAKEKMKQAALEAASEAKDEAFRAAATYADGKVADVNASLARAGVAADDVKDLKSAFIAYQKIREEENRSGKPYEPVTGSLITDLIAAVFASRYAGKGVDRLAGKFMSGGASKST